MDIDMTFKALADPGRRRLLDLLHDENGQTLGDLCRQMEMTRQGVTQHLALLEEANLVATVWRGREKLHYLNPVPLQEIYDRWIEKFERDRLKVLREFKRHLETPDERGRASSTSPKPAQSLRRSARRPAPWKRRMEKKR